MIIFGWWLRVYPVYFMDTWSVFQNYHFKLMCFLKHIVQASCVVQFLPIMVFLSGKPRVLFSETFLMGLGSRSLSGHSLKGPGKGLITASDGVATVINASDVVASARHARHPCHQTMNLLFSVVVDMELRFCSWLNWWGSLEHLPLSIGNDEPSVSFPTHV